MTVYLDMVMLLNFTVDLLLLLGTNRLAGYPSAYGRVLLASVLGGLYSGVCMLPGFYFLGNSFWRAVSLAAMSVIAFGWNGSTLRRGVLFALLSMALGGLALGLDSGSFVTLIAAAAALCGMCFLAFHGKFGGRQFVSVELCCRGKKCHLTALADTGNTLKDPITGTAVLVVGAEVGRMLLGLTEAQLRDPIVTMQTARIPGLRLIPYRAVGQASGMLLAARMDEVTINGKTAGRIVAFSPVKLGAGEGYEALAGGVL